MTSKDELHLILKEEELKNSVLLVFANKQDIPGSLTDVEITESLDLTKIKDRQWSIFKVIDVDWNLLLNISRLLQ